MDYSYDYGDSFDYGDYGDSGDLGDFSTHEGYNNFDDFVDSDGFEENFAGGLVGGAITTFLMTYLVIVLIVAAFMVVAQWKVFTKANKPGWAAIIPVYSQWVLFETVGMQGWLALLQLIPFIGALVVLVLMIIAYIKLATCFGKDTGFALGLILLPIVFMPILAFGKSQYTQPAQTTV